MTKLNKRNDGSINPCFLENLIDSARTIAYLMDCIGDSVNACGVPSDLSVFNQTMCKLSSDLDGIADALEVACDDLKEDEQQSRDTLRIAVKHVGSDPVMTETSVTLGALQDAVKGYMGIHVLTDKLAIVCNQLGKFDGLEHNCDIGKTSYYGTVIFIGMDDEGRFTSVTEEQVTGLFE